MYLVKTTVKFDKALKLAKKRGLNKQLIKDVVILLSNSDNPLPDKFRDHKLKGNLKDYRECHIASDWLLIYQKNKKELILLLIDTGKHNELFR